MTAISCHKIGRYQKLVANIQTDSVNLMKLNRLRSKHNFTYEKLETISLQPYRQRQISINQIEQLRICISIMFKIEQFTFLCITVKLLYKKGDELSLKTIIFASITVAWKREKFRRFKATLGSCPTSPTQSALRELICVVYE